MRVWKIEEWQGDKWVKVDDSPTRRDADWLLNWFTRYGKGRFRIVNPRGRVVLHRGVVQQR